MWQIDTGIGGREKNGVSVSYMITFQQDKLAPAELQVPPASLPMLEFSTLKPA